MGCPPKIDVAWRSELGCQRDQREKIIRTALKADFDVAKKVEKAQDRVEYMVVDLFEKRIILENAIQQRQDEINCAGSHNLLTRSVDGILKSINKRYV